MPAAPAWCCATEVSVVPLCSARRSALPGRVVPANSEVPLTEQPDARIPDGVLAQMERVKGIEPSSSAWKAVALPLSYTRELVPKAARLRQRLRRATVAVEAGLPTAAPQARRLVGEAGLEPAKRKPADLQSYSDP